MFSYCTEVLKFSEAATYKRLRAARAARQNPQILVDLATGALNLSAIKLLAPHLHSGNQGQLLDASRHKSKREVEKLVRSFDPLPDVASAVRKLPAKRAEAVAPAAPTPPAARTLVLDEPREAVAETRKVALAAPACPSVIAPLTPERYKVQFTASEAVQAKLRHAQDLLRHRIPNGDIAMVFELALNALVEQLEKQKFAATDRPRAGGGVSPDTRIIPAAVKRAVWQRDGGRCAFVAPNGRRCSETGCLEFHHVVAFALGGQATVENIALRCRAHNQFEARLEFGRWETGTGADCDGVVRETAESWMANGQALTARR